MIEKIKKIPKNIWIILAVILLGIFLRTYNFHDWLRFNADQSRDAAVVNDFLEGKTTLPLLGPRAGGTDFKLGPAFYYFQIVSAKIFGAAPDKMAYPDLLFSILAIPLLYLLLSKYFNRYISVASAALLSVSMFAVQYSRFAWNPNSSPFFVFLFLYSLLKIADKKENKKIAWAIAAGIALGIGIQLHTMLLIVMPATAIIFLAYLYAAKTIALKEYAVIFLFALILNIPQIYGEFQSGGQNMRAFFGGAAKKTSNEMSISEKVVENFLCQIQSDNYLVSAKGPSGDCGKTVISGEFKRHSHFDKLFPIVLETILGSIFTIGGFIFWILAIRKESNREKKKFLVLLGIYFLSTFIILMPVANEISTRFYLALEFVPFLLFGFWAEAFIKLAGENHKKFAIAVLTAIFVLLAGANVYKTGKIFMGFSFQEGNENDNVDNDTDSFITLGETEFIANYISSHAEGQKEVYLEGREVYLFKYLGSINYLTAGKEIKVKEYSEKENLPENSVAMFLGDSKNIKTLDNSVKDKYFSDDIQSYGRFSIAVLKKRP